MDSGSEKEHLNGTVLSTVASNLNAEVYSDNTFLKHDLRSLWISAAFTKSLLVAPSSNKEPTA